MKRRISQFKSTNFTSVVLPFTLLLGFVLIVIPLPAWCLDVFFTVSIGMGLLMLLSALHSNRPIDFNMFPSLVLLATLFRLILNIASTRVILLNGHTSEQAAGQVIQAFSSVVIGSDYTVGIILFSILVIINFIVITKGAGRVSEVSARFTLDALPGKQLAIDADISSGHINQKQAKSKREELIAEANFYGAMDGASKFVRGDAIAGIIILLINLIGGVLIGTLQHDMHFSVAVQRYFSLTVGDGLVAQLPALLISTATAIVVTRGSQSQPFGPAVYQQLINQPQNLLITGSVVGMIALLPGMPHLVFITMALFLILTSYYQRQQTKQPAIIADKKTEETTDASTGALDWDIVQIASPIVIRIGYQLVKAIQDEPRYLQQIWSIRQQLSVKYGFLIPVVKFRDDLQLDPNQYQIFINGFFVGDGIARPTDYFKVDANNVDEISELFCLPSPNMAGTWVAPSHLDHKCVYIDCPTLLSGHIQQVIQQQLGALFDHEALAGYLTQVRKQYPEMSVSIEESGIEKAFLLKVLKNLLQDKIPIVASNHILPLLIDVGLESRDPQMTAQCIRRALRQQTLHGSTGAVASRHVLQLDKKLERKLHSYFEQERHSNDVKNLLLNFNRMVQRKVQEYQSLILVVSVDLRRALSHHLQAAKVAIPVLSYAEVADEDPGKVEVIFEQDCME